MTGGRHVYLVDDDDAIRRSASFMLKTSGFTVATFASGTDFLNEARDLDAGCVLLDVRMPDGNGVELCRELRDLVPGLACLMLTSFADDQALLDAVLAGAAGYVLKNVRGNDLVEGVRTVAAGGSLLDPHAASLVLARLRSPRASDPLERLSEQERRILELIGEGLTNREIAARLFLAEKTVKNYVSNVLSKLGLQRRTQVAVLATELRQRSG